MVLATKWDTVHARFHYDAIREDLFRRSAWVARQDRRGGREVRQLVRTAIQVQVLRGIRLTEKVDVAVWMGMGRRRTHWTR